jgi:adenylate cyclase
VLHVWGRAGVSQGQTYTITADNLDWAFCTPVGGEACRGWGIYGAGRLSTEQATAAAQQWETTVLRDDLKFTELVAAVLSALIAGDWERAYDLLRRMPAEDQVPDFLTVLIAKHGRRAPADWQGVIALESKS